MRKQSAINMALNLLHAIWYVHYYDTYVLATYLFPEDVLCQATLRSLFKLQDTQVARWIEGNVSATPAKVLAIETDDLARH